MILFGPKSSELGIHLGQGRFLNVLFQRDSATFRTLLIPDSLNQYQMLSGSQASIDLVDAPEFPHFDTERFAPGNTVLAVW